MLNDREKFDIHVFQKLKDYVTSSVELHARFFHISEKIIGHFESKTKALEEINARDLGKKIETIIDLKEPSDQLYATDGAYVDALQAIISEYSKLESVDVDLEYSDNYEIADEEVAGTHLMFGSPNVLSYNDNIENSVVLNMEAGTLSSISYYPAGQTESGQKKAEYNFTFNDEGLSEKLIKKIKPVEGSFEKYGKYQVFFDADSIDYKKTLSILRNEPFNCYFNQAELLFFEKGVSEISPPDSGLAL